ncbi:transmembrane sensor [Pedobacter sp. UYP30]|uniref:FecR family protein n=1 Tax=Pedobacter sp. UYP30 TaxID=1756400 RepID=UPI003390ECEF
MHQQPSRLKYLLQQYADSNCTREELVELFETLNKTEDDRDFDEVSLRLWENVGLSDPLPEIDKEQIFHNLMRPKKVRLYSPVKYRMIKWAAAAVLLFALSFGLYRLGNKGQQVHNQISANKIISPGTDKAVLTLANGKTITLDDNNGTVVAQGNTTIIKFGKGFITYRDGKVKEQGETVYHTLSTPKGGQYQIELPDGTKVWLNSLSSLRFPEQFQGNSRKVFLTGEGYFEVAKNKNKPFIVDINNTAVKVLGTHFNIMGYDDETSTNTTLLEGSVRITAGKNTSLLKPGEQAKVNDGIQVSPVDVTQYVAWKNGDLNFAHEKIQSIMKKISRWYDIDIKYQGKITDEGFVGNVKRSKNLSEVLDVLESTGLVHFKIEGRSVIVMP